MVKTVKPLLASPMISDGLEEGSDAAHSQSSKGGKHDYRHSVPPNTLAWAFFMIPSTRSQSARCGSQLRRNDRPL